ncbi:response regulator [Paenibacillus alba]|uniref:Response regulator n=1 Tax=Paenibacillus alba TaxID=1197127 RepID=A0ABU6G114_9BACL|nr:response regulator [Paenibacillus alba]MEC0227670.1 response regulator [Paenibacillus alba]
MYTAIIVDDEPWIIEGLKAGIDWGERGFTVIGDARNGQEALALIERLQPDFVLTDIKMPLLNGLELIKKGKAVSEHTLFVVLSGHAEFTYAQKALNFGAFGYCLKPFEIEEIQSMLKRLSEALAAKRNRHSHDRVAELYEAICTGEMDTVKRVLEENRMPLNDARTSIIPIVVQGKELPLAWPNIKHLGFRMSLRRYGFLVYEHHVKAFLQSVVEAYGIAPYSIGIGHSLSDLAGLEGSVESASLAAYGLFSTGKPGVYYSAVADSPIVEHLKRIADAITREDRIQFVACMETTRAHFHDGTFRMNDAYLLFTSTMYLFTRDGMKAGGKLFEGYQQLYEHFGNVDAMLDYLIVHTSGFIVEDIEARTMSVSHKKIKDILLYQR